MNLVEISNHADKIIQEQREAILSLIDVKTNNDMEKVINAIAHLESRIDGIEKVVDNKINTLYWVLGVIGAFITIVVSIVMAIVSR